MVAIEDVLLIGSPAFLLLKTYLPVIRYGLGALETATQFGSGS